MGLFQSKPSTPSALPVLGAAPPPPAPVTSGSSFGGILRILVIIVGASILLYIAYVFYNYLRKRNGQDPINLFSSDSGSGDQLPSPSDGKKKTTISAANTSVGTGVDYGVQFWMYVSDWDYNFGKEKMILVRKSPTQQSPKITLHPTENSLNVQVMVFPTDQSAGAATPGAGTTGDSFTCTVENIPLQSWFSVSMTVFQRNLDIYINGRLVKSCVLPGVPKPISGDVLIGDDVNGFSGSVCNVHTYPNMLTPNDAKSFFGKGTSCQAPSPTKAGVDPDSTFITLFGYTFRFSTLNKEGRELSSFTL